MNPAWAALLIFPGTAFFVAAVFGYGWIILKLVERDERKRAKREPTRDS